MQPDTTVIELSDRVVKLCGVQRVPDVGYRDGKRVAVWIAGPPRKYYGRVYACRELPCIFLFPGCPRVFQRVDIVARDGQNHITVEPAVSLGKTRDVLVFHLHLGVQLVQEHFPLVIIAFPVNHLGHPCRLFFTVMRV